MLPFLACFSQYNTSLFAGYGTNGGLLRFEVVIAEGVIKNSSTLVYLEGGLKGKKFEDPNFMFRNVNYSSDTRLLFAGLGLAQQFDMKGFSAAPYLGVRFVYARLKDKALVRDIGENNLIRLWGGTQVGPEVENGYGDVITIDGGLRLGVKLGKSVDLLLTGGLSPVKFNTSTTLFGKYWGEAPYPNDYYINLPVWRAEGGLRVHF